METMISILIGILFAIGTYLILTKQLLRIILGSSLITHAVNLLILTSGGLKDGAPPLIGGKATHFTDALPQALILSAIVINFGVTAILLVLSYRIYQTFRTDDMEMLRGNDDE